MFWGFLGYTSADIDFTWPSPGATLGSGDVTLWWKEDGDSFLIREMGSHLLVLFTGSNHVMVCCSSSFLRNKGIYLLIAI